MFGAMAIPSMALASNVCPTALSDVKRPTAAKASYLAELTMTAMDNGVSQSGRS